MRAYAPAMRALLTAFAGLVAMLAAAASPVTASGSSADLSGTHRCAPAPPYVFSVRVRGIRCARGRSIAKYWETTGRGHCPRGYRTRRFTRPAGTTGLGGSYLNCHRAGGDVFWVEGGE